jgi:molybdopterin molybdotransferase
VTGNEIRTPGEKLQFGEVYDANSYALKAALRLLQIDPGPSVQVRDEAGLLENVLAEKLEQFDLVLTTGGVSVGDYDFLPEAAMRCRIQPIFHKVRQRPGKPLYFGKRGHCTVFGLPGNPGSVFTCFYEYVALAIEKMTGLPPQVKTVGVPLGVSWEKKPGLTHFLKGRLEEGLVFPLDAQESYRMRTFAQANCLIRLEEEAIQFKKGQTVEVHTLPS